MQNNKQRKLQFRSWKMKIRIYYEDTDISGFVYHSNYLNFCERARSELFFQNGLSPIDGNSHFVVSKLEAKFIQPAKFGDILEVDTKVAKIGGYSVQLLQTILRDEVEIFRMDITLAYLKNGKLAKIDRKTKEIFYK